MPFVKLDTGILNSTLWVDLDARVVFITALLMAEPHELREPARQMEVRTLDFTGWVVPPGWYGHVPAAGLGIIHRAGVENEAGLAALERLGSPEPSSRSRAFDGRRLVRVDGGYLALNYIEYRERDYGAADRMRRLRERRRGANALRNGVTVPGNVTHADAEAYNDLSIRGDPPPKNPLVDREALVKEGHDFIGQVSRLQNLDPTEVLSKASRWNGRSYVRLDTMTDERLAHTVNELRGWWREVTGQPEPGPPTERPRPTAAAQAREDAANAMIQGGLDYARRYRMERGLEGAGGKPPGPGPDAGHAPGPRPELPAGADAPDE